MISDAVSRSRRTLGSPDCLQMTSLDKIYFSKEQLPGYTTKGKPTKGAVILVQVSPGATCL